MSEDGIKPESSGGISRRHFVSDLSRLSLASALLSTPVLGMAGPSRNPSKSWTVGEIMDLFIKEVPGAPFPNTVDTLKAGSRDIQVTGVVTSMFPTIEVIKKAIALHSNFLIVHEPTFYNHTDATDWLEKDDVYQYKKQLLQQNQMAVWRNHDYVHSHLPDGVLDGVVSALGWKAYQDKENKNIFQLPAVTVKTLIQQVKTKLGITSLRYMGDLSLPCQKILLLPGAYGGRRQIESIAATKPDVLLCGEIQEWETAEYIRDANSKGQRIALVVMGHVDSEEPGSLYMASWLRRNLPGVKVTHIPARNPLRFG